MYYSKTKGLHFNRLTVAKGKTDACLLRSEKVISCLSGGQPVYNRGKDIEHECTWEQVSTEEKNIPK